MTALWHWSWSQWRWRWQKWNFQKQLLSSFMGVFVFVGCHCTKSYLLFCHFTVLPVFFLSPPLPGYSYLPLRFYSHSKSYYVIHLFCFNFAIQLPCHIHCHNTISEASAHLCKFINNKICFLSMSMCNPNCIENGKVIGTHLVKKYPIFCETWRLIAILAGQD